MRVPRKIEGSQNSRNQYYYSKEYAAQDQQVTLASPDPLLQEIRDLCAHRLAAPDLREISDRLDRRGLTHENTWHLLSGVTESPATQQPVDAVRIGLGAETITLERGAFERCLLLRAALHASTLLPALPVTPRVKRLFCDEFRYVATADATAMIKMLVGSVRFAEIVKIITLRRFPAGQFDWEVSGVPRSDLLRVHPARLPGVAAFILRRMGGLGPVFFSHLNPRRPQRALLEVEANRSYYQMARSMEMQRGIKGFAACSWFRSPATHAVSPHLAWLSRVFLEHGGLVVEAGADTPESGVLHRSATRRRLYEAGEFKPTRGLVLWPRRAMLTWADAHPELGSQDGTRCA